MAAPNLQSPTSIVGKTTSALLNTTWGTVLDNPASSGKVLKVNSAYCSNMPTGDTEGVFLAIYDGTYYCYISNGIEVPTKATQVLVSRDAYIYIEEGKSLRAKATISEALELVVGYEDIE